MAGKLNPLQKFFVCSQQAAKKDKLRNDGSPRGLFRNFVFANSVKLKEAGRKFQVEIKA